MLGTCDASPNECVILPILFHMFTHTHIYADSTESYCEEDTQLAVTIATLINRTSVDVTWCYQILIKPL